MALTEEQKERIRKNRERALRIKKERMERLAKEKKEEEDKKRKWKEGEEPTVVEAEPAAAAAATTEGKRQKVEEPAKKKKKEEEDVELEEFEIGASEWITKSEAMKVYCVPQGTLAVCQVEERPNPHHASWKPMKLYLRSEIRKKARKRFGGLEGLVEERKKRRQKQLDRDMAKARSIFK